MAKAKSEVNRSEAIRDAYKELPIRNRNPTVAEKKNRTLAFALAALAVAGGCSQPYNHGEFLEFSDYAGVVDVVVWVRHDVD